jgi:hypothetical protein
VPKGLGVPFFLVTALFFMWGVPSNLNDVLIRQFIKSFASSRFQAGLTGSCPGNPLSIRGGRRSFPGFAAKTAKTQQLQQRIAEPPPLSFVGMMRGLFSRGEKHF